MDCQLHGTEHSSRHIDDCSVCFYLASTCSWNFVSLFLNGWLEHLELWSVHVSLLLWDFSARWFVPWLCLPHVYNYRRFLQAKGHRVAGTSNLKDRIQMDTRYIKKIKIHKLKFSKRSPLIWQNLANLVAINFLSNVIKSCAGASSRLRMRHLYARNHFRGTFWLVMAVVVQKWSHFLNTSWVCQSSVAWSRLLSWLSNLRDFDVVENSFTNGCMKFCCEGRSADCNDTLWTSLSRVLLGKAGTNYSTASFLLSLKSV